MAHKIDKYDGKNKMLSTGMTSPRRKQKDSHVVKKHNNESTNKDIKNFLIFDKSKKYALSFSTLFFILEFLIGNLKPSFIFTLIYYFFPLTLS